MFLISDDDTILLSAGIRNLALSVREYRGSRDPSPDFSSMHRVCRTLPNFSIYISDR